MTLIAVLRSNALHVTCPKAKTLRALFHAGPSITVNFITLSSRCQINTVFFSMRLKSCLVLSLEININNVNTQKKHLRTCFHKNAHRKKIIIVGEGEENKFGFTERDTLDKQPTDSSCKIQSGF